jgi:hypothetical protein
MILRRSARFRPVNWYLVNSPFMMELLFRQLNTLKVVMPDLIRHPVSPMDSGFRRNDGNSIVLLPEYIEEYRW